MWMKLRVYSRLRHGCFQSQALEDCCDAVMKLFCHDLFSLSTAVDSLSLLSDMKFSKMSTLVFMWGLLLKLRIRLVVFKYK